MALVAPVEVRALSVSRMSSPVSLSVSRMSSPVTLSVSRMSSPVTLSVSRMSSPVTLSVPCMSSPVTLSVSRMSSPVSLFHAPWRGKVISCPCPKNVSRTRTKEVVSCPSGARLFLAPALKT